MSVTTYPTAPALPVRPTNMTTNFSRILKGEWTKLRTLPSTWRTAVFAFVFSIGAGAVLVISQASQWTTMTPAQRANVRRHELLAVRHHDRRRTARVARRLRSVTAEYASGMIRSTFTAMPTRRLVLAGKAAIVAAFAFPVVLVSNFVAFEIGQRIFAGKHLQVTLGHPGVLTAIVFGAVGSQPHRRHRSRSRRRHSTHRRGDRCDGRRHRRRGHVRPASSGRLAWVPARHRPPGGRDRAPLARDPRARHGHRGPRGVCGDRVGGGFDTRSTPRRLTQ